MKRFCTQCGNPLEEDDKFCSSCGCKVEMIQTPVTVENNNIEDTAKASDTEEVISAAEEPVFGQAQPEAPVFGQAEPEAPVFGQVQPEAPVFGQIQPEEPVFGQAQPEAPVFGQAQPEAPVFGQVQQPETPVYGQNITADNYTQQQVPPQPVSFGFGENISEPTTVLTPDENINSTPVQPAAPAFGQPQQQGFNQGQPVFGQQPQFTAVPPSAPVKTKKKKGPVIAIVGGIIVLLGALVFLVYSLFGESVGELFGGTSAYEKPIANFCKALEKGDEDLLESLFRPSFWGSYYEPEDFIESYEYQYSNCGDITSVTYKIKKEEEITSKSDISDIEEYFEYWYDEEEEVDAAYEVTCRLTIKGEDDTEKITETLVIVKIDGKWYLTDYQR